MNKELFIDEVVIVEFFKNKYHKRNIENYSHLLIEDK